MKTNYILSGLMTTVLSLSISSISPVRACCCGDDPEDAPNVVSQTTSKRETDPLLPPDQQRMSDDTDRARTEPTTPIRSTTESQQSDSVRKLLALESEAADLAEQKKQLASLARQQREDRAKRIAELEQENRIAQLEIKGQLEALASGQQVGSSAPTPASLIDTRTTQVKRVLDLGTEGPPSRDISIMEQTPSTETHSFHEIHGTRKEYLSPEIWALLANNDNCAKALSKAIKAIKDEKLKIEIIEASKTEHTLRLMIGGERANKAITWK